MNRILKKDDLLITSTDYWEEDVDTRGLIAYHKPVYVYNREALSKLLKKVYLKGFKLFDPEIDLNCQEKAIKWKRFNFDFTFLTFCLQKIRSIQ